MRRVLLLSLMAFGVHATPGAAQHAVEKSPSSFLLRLDNDLVAGTDRGYTGGLALSRVLGELSKLEARRWQGIVPGVGRADAHTSLYVTLGQSIYTPDDLRTRDLVVDDRPYAGVLYLAAGALVRHARHEDVFELTAGIVGPASQAERSQKLLHEAIRDVIPRGWDNQLRNEPLLQLALERRWKRLTFGTPDGFAVELLPHIGGGAGNLAIYSSVGAYARAGWNLPGDFGPGSIRPGGRRWAGIEDAAKDLTVQLYAGVDGKAVLRDLLLDGNTFQDSHRVPRKPWTSDFILGVEVSEGRFSFGYEFVRWTRRFEKESREQFYSSFTISVR